MNMRILLVAVAVWLLCGAPSAGPLIRVEAGQRYIPHFYWSAAVGAVLHATAAYMRLKLRRARRPEAQRQRPVS